MPRLLQSTLHPSSASEWLDDLRGDSRIVTLSPAHPTLLVRLRLEEGMWISQHELVFGLFRTVWHCPAKLDLDAGRLIAKGWSQHFQSFEQTLCWSQTEHGLSLQSDLTFEGARSGLEDLLLRSLLRFPGLPSALASERPTQRIAMEGQAAA